MVGISYLVFSGSIIFWHKMLFLKFERNIQLKRFNQYFQPDPEPDPDIEQDDYSDRGIN